MLVFIPVFFAEAQTVIAKIDRDSIAIGEQVRLTLVADLPDSLYKKLQWFNVKDTLGKFEVVEKGAIDSVLVQGGFHYSQSIILSCFEDGRWEIPSFTMHITTKKERLGMVLNTIPLIIEVSAADISRLKDYNDVKDILPVSQEKDTQWLPFVIVIFVLGVFIWMYVKRISVRKAKKKLPAKANQALQNALGQLSVLEDVSKSGQITTKKAYQELYQICRNYYAHKFGENVLHCTTEEWKMSLEKKGLEPIIKVGFYELLHDADNIRFARLKNDIAFSNAIATVREVVFSLSEIPVSESDQ